MRVVLLGKGIMLAGMIEGCINALNTDIVGVLRYENLTHNRFQLAVKDFFSHSVEEIMIKKYELAELNFKSANSPDFRDFLLKNNVDMVLVGTWKEKISKKVYTAPNLGFVNIHPSLLPKYRGPNPYLQVIKNREPFSGFTFHKVDENFDTGEILYQSRVEILPFYTSKELREAVVFEVKKALPDFLYRYENGEITPLKQDENIASYYPNIEREDMMLDFERETAEEIVARIKALHPWLPCYVTTEKGFYIPNPYHLRIENTSETVLLVDTKNKLIKAKCKDGKVVVMENVKKYRRFI